MVRFRETATHLVTEAEFRLLAIVWFGAVCMHLYSNRRQFDGIRPYLSKAWPSLSEACLYRIDLLITPLVGAGIGYIFFSPTNPMSALAAGVSWTAAFQILVAGRSDTANKQVSKRR
jgi:hypothetical protein